MPQSLLLLESGVLPMDSLLRGLRTSAAGADIVRTADLSVAARAESVRAVFVDPSLLAEAGSGLLQDIDAPWFALSSSVDEQALTLACRHRRMCGVIAWGEDGPRPFEIHYVMRRVRAPQEAPVFFSECLGFGVTQVSFRPRTTEEQRDLVRRIEPMCRRLGVERKAASATSLAMHELTMNAMYDAPIGAGGVAKYAANRTASISLDENEVPTARLTVSTDFVIIDVVDPFGRLPRSRFFEGLRRGYGNAVHGRSEIDTSHGGAGLGLYTLFSAGHALRAELAPNQLTHVSWVYDRRQPRVTQDMARSVYFFPVRAA